MSTIRSIVKAVLPIGIVASLLTVNSGTAIAEPNLDAIVKCESGGDIRAQNPTSTASGKYQFLDSTWRGLGGKGSAKDASEAEQDRMARKLHSQSGTTPWNASKSCWKGKGGSSATAPAPAPTKKRAVQAASPAPRVAPSRPAQPAGTPKHTHTAQKKNTSQSGNYTVKRGDTLSHIAIRNNTTWQTLHKLNKSLISNPNVIMVGWNLTLVK